MKKNKDKYIVKIGQLKSGKSLIIEKEFTKYAEKQLIKEYGYVRYKLMDKKTKEELIKTKKEELIKNYENQ